MAKENESIVDQDGVLPIGIHVAKPDFSEEWECHCFGTGTAIILTPEKHKVPNWFWRKMQYLILGNKWIKSKKND